MAKLFVGFFVFCLFLGSSFQQTVYKELETEDYPNNNNNQGDDEDIGHSLSVGYSLKYHGSANPVLLNLYGMQVNAGKLFNALINCNKDENVVVVDGLSIDRQQGCNALKQLDRTLTLRINNKPFTLDFVAKGIMKIKPNEVLIINKNEVNPKDLGPMVEELLVKAEKKANRQINI